MNAHLAHVINSFCLILMGGWGFFETNAKTALIPVFFGVVLLSLSNGVKYNNKAIAHIVVVLTLLVLGALIAKPLMSALNDNDTLGITRIGLMCFTSFLALVFFIKSFIDARKAKKA